MSSLPHQSGGTGVPPASSSSSPSDLWARVLESANKRLASILDDFRLESLDTTTAILIGRAQLVPMAQVNAPAIEDLLSRAAGRTLRAEFRADQTIAAAAAAAAASAPPPVNLNDHPLVKQAIELFGVKTQIRVVPRKKSDTSAS